MTGTSASESHREFRQVDGLSKHGLNEPRFEGQIHYDVNDLAELKKRAASANRSLHSLSRYAVIVQPHLINTAKFHPIPVQAITSKKEMDRYFKCHKRTKINS